MSSVPDPKITESAEQCCSLDFELPRNDHISPHLMSLLWLPIEYRIKYKLSCICFNSVSGTAPSYLSSLLSLYTPSRPLRSSSDGKKFCVPLVSTRSFGQRSFVHSAPSVWNSLPYQLRSSGSLVSFKSALKTHLYTEVFGQGASL